MRTIKAHFDGKVIVPDEPLDLPAGTAVTVDFEAMPSAAERPRTDFREWIGLALKYPESPNYRFRSDDDLWKKDHE